MKLEFSRRILEKSSKTKFSKNPSSGSRVDPCGRTDGRTDRHDEANSSFSQFLRQRLNSDLLPSVGTGSIAIEEVFKNRCLVCNIGVSS